MPASAGRHSGSWREWHWCAGWLLACIALWKAPNRVQLQKQFSSFASKKHKAAIQRAQAGEQAVLLAGCCPELMQHRANHPDGLVEAGQQPLKGPLERRGRCWESLVLECPGSTDDDCEEAQAHL